MKKNLFGLLTLVIVIAFAFAGCGKGGDYKKALSLFENGQYGEAASIFQELGDYENSVEMAKSSKYQEGKALFDAGSFEEARNIFSGLGEYEDCKALMEDCDHQIMLQTYADVFKALDGKVWYFNGGADNIMNSIAFKGEKAVIAQIYFDGNWKHDNGSTEHTFVADEKNITVVMEDESTLQIPYSLKDNQVLLDSKEYVTAEEIDDAIQGYWKVRTSNNVLGNAVKREQCIYINRGKLVSESVTGVMGSSDGEYYYYGPYEGTYKLDFGGFDTDMRHGQEWFYNIIDGEIFVFHGEDKCEKTDKLPGENGYKF